MTFLPKGYEQPKTAGNYFKFAKGENRFRILGPAVVGYEYWNTDNKPVRSPEGWEDRPADMKPDTNVKHFWAFPVWNYDASRVQVMELTQKSIMGSIKSYVENKKWGDPTGYDLVVTRTGEGLETEYTTIAEPHSPAPKADISKVNVKALFGGGDPFSEHSWGEMETGIEYPDEKIDPESIPF